MKSKVHYPKGGRKPKLTRGAKEHSQRTGDVYRYRPTMGDSEEEQYRRRMNWYGKKAPDNEPVTGGMVVSPLRTIISV